MGKQLLEFQEQFDVNEKGIKKKFDQLGLFLNLFYFVEYSVKTCTCNDIDEVAGRETTDATIVVDFFKTVGRNKDDDDEEEENDGA